jgi:hypothetical protein
MLMHIRHSIKSSAPVPTLIKAYLHNLITCKVCNYRYLNVNVWMNVLKVILN